MKWMKCTFGLKQKKDRFNANVTKGVICLPITDRLPHGDPKVGILKKKSFRLYLM